MPHTTYGLFVAMRSHRIDNPSATVSLETGRPNACNLCHLDRTLAWTAEKLSEWYGQPEVAVTGDHAQTAASLVWVLRGDAAQRAVTAWNMSWAPAREASGQGWQAPFLARLMIDPYSAVRKVAHDSLRRLPGFEEFEYDYLAVPQQRFDVSLRALETWRRGSAAQLDRRGEEVLIDGAGRLMMPRIDHLVKQRDDRPTRIIE